MLMFHIYFILFTLQFYFDTIFLFPYTLYHSTLIQNHLSYYSIYISCKHDTYLVIVSPSSFLMQQTVINFLFLVNIFHAFRFLLQCYATHPTPY